MPSIGLTVLWFLVIVAAIPLTLWVLKRSGVAQGALGGSPAMFKTIAQMSIGQGQRLMAVEVGQGDDRQWLVLGVTPQSINILHTMAPQALPQSQPTAVHPAFATLLQRFSATQSSK
jgi:flagellar protein FliO/FliZ